MKRGQLSDYFEGVGVKRLSAVDAEQGCPAEPCPDPAGAVRHEAGDRDVDREGLRQQAGCDLQRLLVQFDQGVGAAQHMQSFDQVGIADGSPQQRQGTRLQGVP